MVAYPFSSYFFHKEQNLSLTDFWVKHKTLISVQFVLSVVSKEFLNYKHSFTLIDKNFMFSMLEIIYTELLV